MSKQAGRRAREWASERVGQWVSGQGKGGERGEQQQLLFSVHHYPNFYDFFLRAIAPFTGNLLDMLSISWRL